MFRSSKDTFSYPGGATRRLHKPLQFLADRLTCLLLTCSSWLLNLLTAQKILQVRLTYPKLFPGSGGYKLPTRNPFLDCISMEAEPLGGLVKRVETFWHLRLS